MFVYLIFAMTLSLVTLNTGGCTTALKNASIRTYVNNLCNDPDIVFLQETFFLNSDSPVWKMWSYTPLCAPSPTRGSGITTLIKKKNIDIIDSKIISDGHIFFTKIRTNNTFFYLYNFLVPQNDKSALEAIQSFQEHCAQLADDGVIVIGGDFNCTEDPIVDRLRMPIEHRPRVASALSDAVGALSLRDIWRSLNPGKQTFTWFRNSLSSESGSSRARLDRFYGPPNILSSVHSSKIIPCTLSDHFAVSLQIKLPSAGQRGSAYWHFNNSLLSDNSYKQIINNLWANWTSQKGDFPDISLWWDIGKSHIKSITQKYSQKIARERREAIAELNQKIDRLQSAPDLAPRDKEVLKEQRDNLNQHLKSKAKGALVRSRFQHINETDSCTSYFFNLEKNNSISKSINKIRLPSGLISEDPAEIKTHIHTFYQDLYSRVPTDESAFNLITEDLDRLEPQDAEDLDSPLSLGELDLAVEQLGINKSPGLDGLSSEFFQCFWPLLKNDLLSVINHSLTSGSLPRSFSRAVITLLPKKGDLSDIANWRPVSLLNTDYKIYARLLANRLKQCIHSVVQKDQTYCVPGRSIFDNIDLIRDILMFSNFSDAPLAVVGLDQKKAFDNVDHGYLINTMRAMGFGEVFLSYLQLLYSGSESLIKVCGSLTSPFPFEKGIRQGCPLSGLLYSIAIEPLLNKLRCNINKSGFKLPDTEKYCSVSAYADDVSVFVTSDAGFVAVEETYDLFGRASAACLNTTKSKGLWAGSWVKRTDRPLGFEWNSEGLKFLGVHLGNNSSYHQLNWKNCTDKLKKTLTSWKNLSLSLSLKGRILIANQLAASKTFHSLATLPPPDHVLDELQRLIIVFVWPTKKHLLKRRLLFQTPDKGGLGLCCLRARTLTYRFTRIQKFLNNYPHPSYLLLSHFLQNYQNLHFDFQLFFIKTDPISYVSIPTFHSEVLRAWAASGAQIIIAHDNVSHVLNVPIHSCIFSSLSADDEPDWSRLLACGIRQIRHILNTESGRWLDAGDVIGPTCRTRPLSTRLLNRHLLRFRSVVIRLFPTVFDHRGLVQSSHLPVNIALKPDPPLGIKIMTNVNGISAPSKEIYHHINHNINELPDNERTHWHDVGFLNKPNEINWKEAYELPSSKKEGDVQFKLFHNVLPSLPVLHHMNSNINPECGWCGERGTIWHLFILCPSIQPTLTLLHTLISRLLPDVPLNFNIYWSLIPHARRRDKQAVRIANYLIVSCKNVIYYLYRTGHFVNPYVIWLQRLKNRILFELFYYRLNCNFNDFEQKWGINNTFFMIVDGELTWLI